MDMLEACANVHNTSSDVVVTDHPHLSELDERFVLDDIMVAVRGIVGDVLFDRWGWRHMDDKRPDDATRWVDGCVEVVLKGEGLLICR